MAERVGFRRQVMGADGDIAVYTESEKTMSETMKMIMFNAPFTADYINKYELLDDSYRGTGGYEDGTYLISHPREKGDKYNRRRQLAYYTNYVKPVVDAQVNPIFKQEPNRQNTSEEYNRFINDVDGNNTTLTRFMKKAAIRAKLHGVEFIVMDMEQLDTSRVITKKDVEDNRLYPYLYLISPSQICDWATDKFGKLIYIKYSIENTTINDKGDKEEYTETYSWTTTICTKSNGTVTETFENTIGEIPVIPLYGTVNNSSDLIPQSDLYPIARTNLAIFNATSELRERQRAQAFSVMTYPVTEDDDYESGADTMKYGTSDCLLYRGDSGSAPDFITPPSGPSETLLSEISFMIQQIYRMACLKDNTTVSQYNVTGIAKEYDNQQLYQVILELAQGLQQTEYKIAHLFNMYMNDKLDNISIVYNNQFGIIDATAALNNATQSLALNISPEFNLQVKKQVIRAVLNSVDSNLVEQIIEDLENQADARNPIEQSQGKVIQPTRN